MIVAYAVIGLAALTGLVAVGYLVIDPGSVQRSAAVEPQVSYSSVDVSGAAVETVSEVAAETVIEVAAEVAVEVVGGLLS